MQTRFPYRRAVLAPARRRRVLRLAGATALAILLAGCASVGPDYVAPAPVAPAAWRGAAAAGVPPAFVADLSRWWTQLGDHELDTLIDTALADSIDLDAARARLREARARRLQAGAAQWPSVTASGAATRSRNDASSAGTVNLYNAGFDASWEADLFGGTRRSIEAAQADLQASQASLHDAQVSLVAEVALNYVELRSAQARLAIAHANLDSQGETLQLTDWRVQAGLASAVDLEQARSNYAQTLAQIPTLQTTLTEAQYRLDILLGRTPGTLAAQLGTPAPLPSLPALPAQLALGIPADTLRQRPDVRAAERRLAADTARIGVATAALYPSLRLSGSIGTEALTLGALGSAGTVARSLAAGVSGVLFDGGALRQQVEIQKAVRDQSLAAYRSSVLTALQDVENALAELSNGTSRRDALRTATEAARNAALLARQRYQSGLIDFQTVLDTERSLRSVEDSLASAEADRVSAFIRLYKALGGGWSAEAASTADPGHTRTVADRNAP